MSIPPSPPPAAQVEQPLGFRDHRRLGPFRVTYVKKLVDDVLGGEATRVVNRRPTVGVIGDHADEAVSDPAELVAHRPGRHALKLDLVVAKAEPRLPTNESAVNRGLLRRHSDNASQYR
jgi:hypothetical protein